MKNRASIDFAAQMFLCLEICRMILQTAPLRSTQITARLLRSSPRSTRYSAASSFRRAQMHRPTSLQQAQLMMTARRQTALSLRHQYFLLKLMHAMKRRAVLMQYIIMWKFPLKKLLQKHLQRIMRLRRACMLRTMPCSPMNAPKLRGLQKKFARLQQRELLHTNRATLQFFSARIRHNQFSSARF